MTDGGVWIDGVRGLVERGVEGTHRRHTCITDTKHGMLQHPSFGPPTSSSSSSSSAFASTSCCSCCWARNLYVKRDNKDCGFRSVCCNSHAAEDRACSDSRHSPTATQCKHAAAAATRQQQSDTPHNK
jgi:hypothetical protein